ERRAVYRKFKPQPRKSDIAHVQNTSFRSSAYRVDNGYRRFVHVKAFRKAFFGKFAGYSGHYLGILKHVPALEKEGEERVGHILGGIEMRKGRGVKHLLCAVEFLVTEPVAPAAFYFLSYRGVHFVGVVGRARKDY